MEWNIEPLKDGLAKVLRRQIRIFRREKGRSGHRFRYDDLKAMFSANEEHVVVTHHEDKLWQYWRKDSEEGWKLESWHRGMHEAMREAEKPRRKPKPEPEPLPGTYVCAVWAHDDYHGSRPMMVRCQNDYTVSVIMEVFKHLGCVTEIREISQSIAS